MRYVSVPGGGASKAVYFPIVLTEVGMIKLSVLAQAGAAAGDAVEEPLRVEPEGYRVDRNVPVIIDLSPSSTSAIQLTDAVNGTTKYVSFFLRSYCERN